MISLQNAGKRFGPRVLFMEANWLIRSKEKTALVGANGTGKSTLMKVIAGLETLDYGSMQQTRGISIGYLPQEGLALAGRSVFDECLTVFDELHEMEREIERLGGQLAVLDHSGAEYESAAERYSLLQERFHTLDGYALDAQVGGVLTGLGFSKEDWSRQTDEFSGGWQMRIALAKLLLAKPNLLLLDEPTNHLDLETRNWLEDYLRTYPFGYILISHDRYFLDVTIDRTVEIWNKRLNIYQGNYTKYLSQKDERRTQLVAAYRNQRIQIEHLEASSIVSAPRQPKRSRCKAASRNSIRSSVLRFLKKSRSFTSGFPSRRLRDAWLRRLTGSQKVTAPSRCSTM
jgi:ATP-binding cassette subfamily F protein 3